MRLSIKFEPKDLWVGVFWDRCGFSGYVVYVCLIPMLPIRLEWGT